MFRQTALARMRGIPALGLALAALLLGACATAPEPPPQPARQTYRQVLDTNYVVEFEIETKLSRIDGKSCFGFISGTLSNNDSQTLSRRSGLQFLVYGRDGLLFRDLTYPRADVPPGARVQFELVQSPVHHQACPRYERIEVVLNPLRLRSQ